MVDLYLGSPIWQVLLGLIILPKYYLVQCIRLHLQSYIYRISGQLHVIERCYIENVYKHWQILFIVLVKEFTWDLLLFWVFKLRWNQLKDHLTEVRSFWTQKNIGFNDRLFSAFTSKDFTVLGPESEGSLWLSSSLFKTCQKIESFFRLNKRHLIFVHLQGPKCQKKI